MFLVGITGNIATGKSTVDAMLAAKGAQVLDADQVVRDLQRRGQPAWRAIVEHFGTDVLGPDGELDRARLGEIVFADPEALRRLELLVHPAVRDEERRRILDAPTGTVLVVDAIKLFESGMADACNSVWVVIAPADQQLARLQSQRGMDVETARRRIEAQPAQAEKAKRAAVVIDNSGPVEHTRGQVDQAWSRIVAPWLSSRV